MEEFYCRIGVQITVDSQTKLSDNNNILLLSFISLHFKLSNIWCIFYAVLLQE